MHLHVLRPDSCHICVNRSINWLAKLKHYSRNEGGWLIAAFTHGFAVDGVKMGIIRSGTVRIDSLRGCSAVLRSSTAFFIYTGHVDLTLFDNANRGS